MANLLHNDMDDETSEYMQSAHEPIPMENQNKPCDKPTYFQKYQELPMPTQEIPPTLPQDRVNASEPKHVTLSKDFIIQATGFHKSDLLLKHFHSISNNSVSIQETDKNPELDEGETATLKSKHKNSTLSDTSTLKVGERFNMDIVYGPTVGIGGIKYALLLIDRKSKRKFIYGLKNLKDSIRNALQQFLVDTGSPPKVIRTDFDHRLIGGQTRKFLLNKSIKVEAAPPKRQHQNGLVERHWQNIVTMARNWMKSQLLSSHFWFFAMKRAVEIANILPVETKTGIIYTPYERAYRRKVDFRMLFPMFSKAYVKIENEVGGTHLNKFKSQTLKTICVGRCPKSDSLLFYHPPSKTLLSNADGYRFDNHTPSGPQFGLKYDGGFHITRKSSSPIHQRPQHKENDTAYVKKKEKYVPVTILQVPIDEESEYYTVQNKETGAIKEVLSENLLDHDPTVPVNDDNQPFNHLYSWIKDSVKVTLYLSSLWKQPRQGTLLLKQNEWYFQPGQSKNATPLHLPNFIETAESMIQNRKLFQGWKTASTIINA